MLQAPIVLVAEIEGTIAGVLRGSIGRLHSLFILDNYHRLGIGTKLMLEFERCCQQKESKSITLASTLYAVPFYTAVGYKKSTGMRTMHSFEGRGLKYQPMKKILQK